MIMREVFTGVLLVTLLIHGYQMDKEPESISLDEYIAGHKQIHQKMEALRSEQAGEIESEVNHEY